MRHPSSIESFIARWSASGAAERANKDSFLNELCDVLDVPRPNPTRGRTHENTYVFERDALLPHEGGFVTVGKIDLYKEGCFILEAKQGAADGDKKVGSGKRGSPQWNIAMRDAYGQALGYARSFSTPVPFIIVCDLGYCFDLYAAFDGSWNYRAFPEPQSSRLFLADLARHKDTLAKIFNDPRALDPSQHAAKVTRRVANHLANLAKALEAKGHAPELVATFLMRSIFTMFAEDVGLLPHNIFTDAIEKFWLPNPASFPGGIESLWRAMNDGGHMFTVGKLLKFNGGLFATPSALPLDHDELKLLLFAAQQDWADVEPAIFGTLLERALDARERHLLGAHFTPRAFVERLVRPTIEEPLRRDWEIVQAQVRQLVLAAGQEDTRRTPLSEQEYLALGRAGGHKAKKRSKAGVEAARTRRMNEALALLKNFHKTLTEITVLDPACGSGNFLYVTFDVFKQLESEILAALEAIGERQELLRADAIRVTPKQFLGIEVKRWAKEIAELVLWLGYLQWHFKIYAKHFPVPEPVLRDYKNIDCRDALLAWDEIRLIRDANGKPVTRWDERTTKKSDVTGEEVPDESAQVPVYEYVQPRRAAPWPEADFIIGNPPFMGKLKLLSRFGDGYVAALRRVYEGDVPDSADHVMYWWHLAAERVAKGGARAFGLVTTKSITQEFNRRIVQKWLDADPGLSLSFAIPNHPWVDTDDAADVRIAMTVGVRGSNVGGVVDRVTRETGDSLEFTAASGVVHADLTVGADVTKATRLRANALLASPGVEIHGPGFIVTREQARELGLGRVPGLEVFIREYRIGRDITHKNRDLMVIDLDGLGEEEVRVRFPQVYQWVHDRVRPGRETNRESYRRLKWWLFARRNTRLRNAIRGLPRYIGTVLTARRRAFFFLDAKVLPDQTIVGIGLDDAYHLGILSSKVHLTFALAAGGRLGVGNDPRYAKTRCFDPFPFPAAKDPQMSRIRELGEQLDSHRKRRQAEHGDLHLTLMYAVLDKERRGEPLTDADRTIHEKGLVSVLRKIHDELDEAVLDAYGWPRDMTDDEVLARLVTLNRARTAEERYGDVKWLRPEFQQPSGPMVTQVDLITPSEEHEEDDMQGKTVAWPKKLADQVAGIRDMLLESVGGWTAEQVAAVFKGARVADIEPIVETLGSLGILVSYKVNGERRWKAAG